MILNGNQNPADAIREEIERLKKEAGMGVTEVELDENGNPIESPVEVSVEETNDFRETNDDPTPIPKEQTVEYWKSRFDVVQGKYHAETAQLREQVNFLKDAVENLKNNPAPSAPQSVDEALDNLEEQYGEDFTKALDSRVYRIVREQMKDVVGQFETDLNSVKQTQQVSEQTLFEDTITSMSSRWRVLNVDPEFVSWVQNTEETFSGLTFQQILIAAYQNRDAAKVANIFNTYEKLKNKQTNDPARPDASNLVAPPRRGSVSNTTAENNSGKVFTMAQVNDFYANLTLGKYRGKDAWVRSMKEEIAKANVEGRIV